MKSIFSKTGSKKDVSSKMDRRTVPNGNVPNQAIVSPNSGRVTSFIPTVATYHNHSGISNNNNNHSYMNGHQGKQIISSPQHHQIAQNNNNSIHAHPNHFYSNIPGREEHQYTNYQQQSMQRSLSKSYSNQQQTTQPSHYGNTLYASNNNPNHNHSSFYGNTVNLPNGAVIMNGHHRGEKSLVRSEVQNSYNQEHHVVHQPQQQVQHVTQKVYIQPQQNSRAHNIHHNHNDVTPSPTDGLPPPLVESMRTLFDILDDSKTGKIRLSDIEMRWESDSHTSNGKASGAEPLIKMGVLEYLRKVTPGDGMLTFDRFCSGLRLALLTTSSNETQQEEPPVTGGVNPAKLQRPPPAPQQQHFQEQVRNMTNSGKMQGSISTSHIAQPQQPMMNGHGSIPVPNKPISMSQLPVSGQINTIQRFSKIPNFPSSKLPASNNGIGGGVTSGIPLSPANKASTIPMVNSNKGQQHSHNSGTLISGMKRYANNTEQTTTTVALVHPQPPPNPKPTTANTGSMQYSGSNIKPPTKTNHSTTGLLIPRFTSKNNSLDDLHVPNNTSNNPTNNEGTQKDRPPSAPILDAEETSKTSESQQLTKQKMRERAKSQERDRVVNNNSHISSRAEEKANFVKSRQRTLSMPQLQTNKLKSKSTVNFDESTAAPNDKNQTSSSSPVEVFPKPSNLKNHSLSKLLAGGHQYGSAIPTVGSSSNNTLRYSNSNKHGDDIKPEKQNKELPPPPPKPPRNGFSIATTFINGLTQEPPLSGSSFSSATISVSASSSSGGGLVSAKPEIRSVLNTWQKNMTDKKASVKPCSSAASIGTNSSMNTMSTCDTTKSAPSGQTTVIINAGAAVINEANMDERNDPVKLRQPTKSSLKRKETARRHTVQSGIDFSTLKRLKHLEQERDVLQQGLQYLEKANEWFLKQMEGANDKISLLSKGAPSSEYWSESHEERLNLLGCRISEVNSLLTALMDGSSQLPLQMNLQIPSHLSLRTITRLKDQNRQLTQEVSDYSHRVTQLENEKALLLRQLFHQKTSSATPSDEAVYM